MLTIKDLFEAKQLDSAEMSAVRGGHRGYGFYMPHFPGPRGDVVKFDNSNNSGVLAAGVDNNAVGSITVNGNGTVTIS